jgi:signal transduction histidine kinase
MAVPLKARNGVLGVISFVAAESGRCYGPEDLRLAEELALRTATAVENARLYEALRLADRRKDQFLATLAHELRNPLAPIRNALYLMTRADHIDLEAVRAMAERQVLHLTRLVNDLMDVSRITRGRIELGLEPLELAPIVDRVVESVSDTLRRLDHALVVQLPKEPMRLLADPTRLQQILWNLLDNAGKYTEPGGRITISATRERDEVLLRVSDNGIGIPARMQPHLFEMFYQPEPGTQPVKAGLGVGLALVKSLVEMHGGTIQARSEGPGRGSEFLVRLPLLPPATPAATGPDDRADLAVSRATTSRRILVVDDNVDAATSLARLLVTLDGHQVRVAHDGPSALELAGVFAPEVAILDIGMPGMDGYEVARRLRSDPRFEKTRLIALSGWSQDGDRRRSREAGMDEHLVKPVDLEALRHVLDDGMD